MAGIWERVKSSIGESDADRLAVHLVKAVYVFYATGAFTKAEIVNGLGNAMDDPLTATELADLDAIADEMDAQATTLAKVVYLLKIEAATIAAETGAIGEAKFRNILNV